MDCSFRRYILVQLLLIFQFLTTPTKFKTSEQVLNEEQQTWVNTKHDLVLHLLSSGKSDESSESSFVSIVQRILDRETFWNRWKNEGCPSFVRNLEKSPFNPRKRRANPLVNRAGEKLYRFGNKELDRLWNFCPDNLKACKDPARFFRPELHTYFQDAIMELDPAEKVDEEYNFNYGVTLDHSDNFDILCTADSNSFRLENQSDAHYWSNLTKSRSINKEEWSWRALRFLSRRCPHFYINWNPPGRSVKDYLTVILTEKIPMEEDRKNAGTSANSSFSAADTVPISDSSNNDLLPAKQPRLDDSADGVSSPKTRTSRSSTSATTTTNAMAATSNQNQSNTRSHSSTKSKPTSSGDALPNDGTETANLNTDICCQDLGSVDNETDVESQSSGEEGPGPHADDVEEEDEDDAILIEGDRGRTRSHTSGQMRS